MSNKNLAQEVADLLKGDAAKAAEGAVDRRMKDLPGIVSKELEGLPGIVRKEMDECLDGKCDAIAERLVAKLPKASTLSGEEITNAVKKAMEGGQTPFNVEGHSAHDILDCPTCRPIVEEKLWANEDYRKKVMENICQDDACRESMSNMFKEKGLGVKEEVEKDEGYSERRLRERAERAAD